MFVWAIALSSKSPLVARSPLMNTNNAFRACELWKRLETKDTELTDADAIVLGPGPYFRRLKQRPGRLTPGPHTLVNTPILIMRT
jgi:hypothetical protein